jgi:hypothetical protein
MIHFKRILNACLCLLLPIGICAQACCSGGTPLSGSLGLQSASHGSMLLGINYDYNTQKSLVTGGNRLDDNPRARNTHSVVGRLGYAFSDRWMAIGLFSLVRQEEVTTLLSGGNRANIAEGIGDALFFVQYTPVAKESVELLLASGAEIPIGRTDAVDDITGLPLHPDMQAGRGAWAFINSVRFTKYHFIRPAMALSAQATFRYTTPADRYQGLQEYQFGNEFRFLAGIADQFLISSALIDPSIMLLYRATSADETNGNRTPNTGGHWLHLRPGLRWHITPAIQLGGFAELPIWWKLEDTQLTTTFRSRVSINYMIGRK